MMKLTQDAAANNQQMLMQSMQFQMETLAKRAEGSGIDSLAKQLLTLNDLRSTLTGGDGESSTLDKVMEVGDKLGTTVLPIVQQVMAARSQARSAASAPIPNPAPMPMAMALPKPVVLDLGPKAPALPAPATQTPPATPTAPAAAAEAAPAPSDGQANDLKDITLPTGGEDLVAAAVLLVKNIDFAIQRNMTAEQIVDQILEPFEEKAPAMMSMAAGLGNSDQLLAFIQSNVPNDWVILSPRGEDIVAEAFELWQGDEEEAA
jgi:hypothetical protein